MKHDFSLVFETSDPLWQRVLSIFEKNEKYEKKVVKNRNLHHKFPRSFSKLLGENVDNDKDNLISLSLADHFLIHYYYYLLAKKGFRQRMAVAFTFMAKKSLKYITPETAESIAKDYDEAKTIAYQVVSDAHKEKSLSDDHKRKISEANKGKHSQYSHKQTEETRNKIRNTQLGKPHPHRSHKMSEETKTKISEANKGKTSWTKGQKWKVVNGKRTYYKEEVENESN